MADLGEPATPPKPTEIQDEGTPLKPRRTRAPMSEEKRQAAADNMRKINQNRIDKARAARSSSIDERLEDVEKKAAAKIAKLHLEKSEIGVYNTKTKRPPKDPTPAPAAASASPAPTPVAAPKKPKKRTVILEESDSEDYQDSGDETAEEQIIIQRRKPRVAKKEATIVKSKSKIPATYRAPEKQEEEPKMVFKFI